MIRSHCILRVLGRYRDVSAFFVHFVMRIIQFGILICALVISFFIYQYGMDMNESKPLNVYGEALKLCCNDPKTGFYRDGYCQTGRDDYGTHIVCAIVTNEFLEYTKEQGNDLSTPNPNFHFPGLRAGDRWCLCVSRWLETMNAGVAPFVDLHATEQSTLDYVTFELLEMYSVVRKN